MSEEENKAIENLKEEIKSLEKAKIEFSYEIEDESWLRKNINELDKDIFYKNTILNLIEKLQEDKRKQSIAIIEYQDLIENCIPKDKIREKIETLKKEATDRLNEGRENIFVTKRLIIDILEELLEEE